MQALWNRAMLLARTRGAYGLAFPMPGTDYRPPCEGSILHDILFASVATEEEYEAHLAAVREDMVAWKERVGNSRGKTARTLNRQPDLSGIDVGKLEFKL